MAEIERSRVGGEVVIKHTRADKVLRHEVVMDKSREASGCIPLEGDPRFKKIKKGGK